jgi:hypothetical protein
VGAPFGRKLLTFTITGRRSNRDGSSTTRPVKGLTFSGKLYIPSISYGVEVIAGATSERLAVNRVGVLSFAPIVFACPGDLVAVPGCAAVL